MRTPSPQHPRDDLRFSNTTWYSAKKKTIWFIGVEVEQETSAPPPKKNPGSAPELKYNIFAANDQVSGSRRDHFSHFVRRR